MMTEIPAVRGFIRMCTDGWEQGWHERNGGNLTYRMKPEEVEQCRPFFTAPREWNSMGVQADNLKAHAATRLCKLEFSGKPNCSFRLYFFPLIT